MLRQPFPCFAGVSFVFDIYPKSNLCNCACTILYTPIHTHTQRSMLNALVRSEIIVKKKKPFHKNNSYFKCKEIMFKKSRN